MKKIYILFFVSLFFLVCNQFAYAQYDFFGKDEWIEIDKQPCSNSDKTSIKLLYIQAVQDASLFSGNPVLPQNVRDFNVYITIVDNLYKREENAIVPLCFLLKMADMIKNNYPPPQINIYRAAVVEKMGQMGISR